MTNKEIIKELYKKYPRKEAELFEQVLIPMLKAQEAEWLETEKIWEKTLNFLKKKNKAQKQDLLEKIRKIIVEEINICHEENQPTSRLTSLAVKIEQL